MATMSPEPVVNHVPTMAGAAGARAVRDFYTAYFIGRHPPDQEVVNVARTVGRDRIVDELVYRCTHTIEMPWLLPGVAPTGRRLELAIVVSVGFSGGRICDERIYWDQATVLAQAGLIDASGLPVCGAEAARKVIDPASEPANALLERGRAGRG
jgi:carboxymethylenebutenolidase